MPSIAKKVFLNAIFVAATSSVVAGTLRTEDQKTWVYEYRSHPTISAYDLLSSGRDQNLLTDELERNHYGVRLVLMGHDNPSGATAFLRDTSHVVPGKVTVRFMDGSHMDANFDGVTNPAAAMVPGSAVDSRGNKLPSRSDQIAGSMSAKSYNFRGAGNPDDQKNFEQFVKLFGVRFTGHGPYESCQLAKDKTITCQRSASAS
jgi:hypothetical protein